MFSSFFKKNLSHILAVLALFLVTVVYFSPMVFEKKILVTSHAAFQYLADAYGLKQLAITGISPEDQPDGKLLAEIADAAKGAGVTTVFFEDVLPADLSEAVAKAIGASTSLLSALEFTPEGSNDYLSMMRENLKNIQAGLNCR